MVDQPQEGKQKLREDNKSMKTKQELQQIVLEGLELVKEIEGLLEGVVYASASRHIIGRLVYTTHIPSNGLEEPKSYDESGISVEVWFQKDGKKLLGFGHEANELSKEGVKRALKKALRDAVEDQEFYGFLKPQDISKDMIEKISRNTLSQEMTFEEEAKFLGRVSWETIQGAVDVVEDHRKKHKLSLKEISFILNGDNSLIQERMALATTDGIVESDATRTVSSTLTAMFEKEKAKGSAWDAGVFNQDFSGYKVGREAALAALNSIGGIRVPTGNYTVVFGHQAVTELFTNLYLAHMNLGMIDFGASMYIGKYGQQVASPLLTVYDDATLPGGAGSKAITCEGYPTGKTMLIENGKLVGYITNSQVTNKILQKGKDANSLFGVDPHEIMQAIRPQNGFRFDDGMVRSAAHGIGIHATNLVVDSNHSLPPEELLKKVDNGIFIGRLWYTYPIGGYSSGIITGTAVADCYTIKNGKLAEPISPNSLRLEDNIGKMVEQIIGIANNKRPTTLWSSDAITYAPWVGIEGVRFVEIGINK